MTELKSMSSKEKGVAHPASYVLSRWLAGWRASSGEGRDAVFIISVS